jgi:ATP-dependent DNA helicase RecG
MRKSRLSSRFLRKTILYALNHISLIPDLLPKQLLSTKKLITYPAALNYIHFPPNYDKLREARKRIIFEEFFRYSLHLHKTKQHISSLKKERTYRFILSEHKALLRKIPYRLTKEQKKAALDIFRDLESPSPMRRLLQGEVGSGKTIVAVISMYLVYLRGYQVCLLAPTEILARQHMGFIQGLGIVPPKDLYLLVSATPPEEREKALMDLLNKDSCFVIGTHALFQEKVSFNNLAYVIIDEQHKFGIHQKAALLNKGRHIDMLLLSATPIPRSLASSLLGALNISTIKRTPFEGAPQQTLLLPRHRIQGVYNSVEKYVYQGKQIYWLFPFIHHNKEMPHVHSLQNGFPDLVERFAPRISVEQIHGQQPLAQKERTMNQFYHGQIDILATTSIIEVGIDNPNATVMIIENPERFGLAALHQIRGRVNRSQEPSFCVLLYNTNLPKETLQRLSIFQKNHSGYFLALQDLKKRGPGDLIDNKQHGMPRFLLADLNRDFSLFLAASESSLAWLHQQNDTGPNPHKIKKHILALQWLS